MFPLYIVPSVLVTPLTDSYPELHYICSGNVIPGIWDEILKSHPAVPVLINVCPDISFSIFYPVLSAFLILTPPIGLPSPFRRIVWCTGLLFCPFELGFLLFHSLPSVPGQFPQMRGVVCALCMAILALAVHSPHPCA